jgi:hypothetical protein
MQDMIISAISDYKYDDIKYWVNSIERSGFKGRKAIVVHNILDETVYKLRDRGFEIFLTSNTRNTEDNGFHFADNFGNRVTVTRHFFNWFFLKNQENIRYVISTDIDVLFQTNPSEWLEQNLGDHKLNYGCEALRYKDEPWGNDNLMRCFGPHVYEEMKDNSIYNAGSMAGDWKTFVDFSLNVYKTIESIQNDVPDQAGVNFLLNLEPYKSITKFNDHDVNWACQLGTTANPHKINHFRPNLLSPEPVFDGHHIYTSKGEKYCLVHQYNKVPDWQAKLEKIYG